VHSPGFCGTFLATYDIFLTKVEAALWNLQRFKLVVDIDTDMGLKTLEYTKK